VHIHVHVNEHKYIKRGLRAFVQHFEKRVKVRDSSSSFTDSDLQSQRKQIRFFCSNQANLHDENGHAVSYFNLMK